MKHYYLLNGTVKKGGEMPNEKDIDTLRDYKQHYNNWLSSLQPCDIDESELKKIKEHLMFYIGEPPIDITDIVSAQVICNADRCDGECIECTNMILKVKFKQPTEKQVESSELIDNIYLFKVNDYTTILLGRKIDDKYIIQRGDGTIYSYDEYRVTWNQKLNIEQPKQVESDCEAVESQIDLIKEWISMYNNRRIDADFIDKVNKKFTIKRNI